MKKVKIRNIVFMLSFIVLLITIEVIFSGNNKNQLMNVNEEESAFADCPEGCLCSSELDGGSGIWYCGISTNPYKTESNNHACCMLHGLCNCSNGCYESWKITGGTCSRCKEGYHMSEGTCVSDGSTPAAPTSSCKITGITRYNLLSNKETRDVFVNTSSCSGAVTITGSGGISVKKISNTHFTITASGKCDSKGSYTIKVENASTSQSVAIIGDWQERQNVTLSHMPAFTTKTAADVNTGWEYGYNCVQSGDKVTCGQYGWRGCGEPGAAPTVDVPSIDEKTALPDPACYANETSLSKATKAKWQNSATSEYPHKIKYLPGTNVLVNSDNCKPMKITMCTPQDITPAKITKTVKNCEKTDGNNTIKYTDGKSCTGVKFYRIQCDNEIKVEFDNGDDMGNYKTVKDYNDLGTSTLTNNHILPGQGFEFGIKATVKRSCTATFFNDSWNEAYDKIVSQKQILENAARGASAADKETIKKMQSELDTKMNKLKQFATDYNNEVSKVGVDLGANFSVEYPTTNENKKLKATFVSSIAKEGKVKASTNKTIKLKDGTSVKNRTWSNYDNPKVIKLVFPNAYLDPNTGEVVEKSKTSVDGGNKLYIDYDAMSSKNGTASTMNITVIGSIGKTEVFQVDNKKCVLKVFPNEVTYRPIDLTNPFINSSYKKGENWVNSKYDFTKTIKATTWSSKALFDVILSAEEIAALKESNNKWRSDSPYLGLCDRVKTTSQDAITKKICSKLK